MKRYSILFVLLFIINLIQAQIQNIEHLNTYSIIDIVGIANQLGVPNFVIAPEFEVDVYRITYETPDPHGNMTIATGALCIPLGDCDFPLASYQHGTVAGKFDVPSYGSGELNLGILIASVGYHMALPDYLGLGGSPGLHPYVHAASEASASVDMILSSKAYLAQENIPINDQVMILGYSQGGHSTMALQKEIETNYSDQINLVLSLPMSGPYDISGVQTEFILSDDPYPTPGYLPYVLFAYDLVYENMFDEPSDIFVAPYDTILPPLFDGTGSFSMGEINAMCPSVPKTMLKPEVVDSFATDPNHRFRVALRDNDLYNDWVPQTETRIYYCMGDDQVNYQNSILALNTFIDAGAPNVQAFDNGNLDHGQCFGPTVFAGKFAMDAVKSACTTGTTSVAIPSMKVYPNPIEDIINIQLPELIQDGTLSIYTITGKEIYQQKGFSGSHFQIENPNLLSNGMYFLKLKSIEKEFQARILVQN